MSEAVRSAGEDSATRVMLFWVGGQCFAVAAHQVLKVMPAPPATRLPLLPQEIAGLVALGGNIVPVLDLRRLLDLHDAEQAGDELVLMAVGSESYAFRVDRVAQIAAGGWTDESRWRDTSVRFLDIEVLLEQRSKSSTAPSPVSGVAGARQIEPSGQAARELTESAAAAALMVETAAGIEILPLDIVTELDENLPIVALPDPSSLLSGAAFYRDALLPVVGLDALLGRPDPGKPSWGAFIVLDIEGRRCVLGVKRVIGLAGEAAEQRVDLKSRLFPLLPEPDSMSATPPLEPAGSITASASRYLLAELGGRTCAFALASVVHIHATARVAPAPTAGGSRLVGVAAVGGRLLPVIGLAALLGLATKTAEHFLELKVAEADSFVIAVERFIGLAAIAPEQLIRPAEAGVISAIVETDSGSIWIMEASAIAAAGRRRRDAA